MPASETSTKPKQTASTESETTKKEKKDANSKEGETVHVGYTSYAVWKSWWSSKLSDNEILNQRPDAMYLFVSLTVRNNDTKPRMVPPFTLIDDKGATYEASSNGWAVKGSIGVLDSLNPSVHKEGFVIFDVPQNRSYRLKLSGGYWSLDDAYVQLTPRPSENAPVPISAEEQKRKEEEAREREAERKAREEAEKAAAEESRWHMWTSANGKYTVEAKFVAAFGSKVRLEKRDGKTIELERDQLSEADQEWIKNKGWLTK